MAALLGTRCAPCSFTLTCRRSQTLPPAWGGMTSTSASAQVFTQLNEDYCPAASFQSVRMWDWILYVSKMFLQDMKRTSWLAPANCQLPCCPPTWSIYMCPHVEMVCDPLGDFNVWASTRPINNTAKGHKMWESVVIAAARVSPSRWAFLLCVSKSDRLDVSQRCTTVKHWCVIGEWVSRRETFSVDLLW